MLLETFNFTSDYQDAILACLIRHPQEFSAFGEIIKPEFFSGVAAHETVSRLIEYQQKYGQCPDFVTLANYASRRAARTNADHAEEVFAYVAKLAAIDTSDRAEKLDSCFTFARERAQLLAVLRIHTAITEGRGETIDAVRIIEDAVSVAAGHGLSFQSDVELASADIPEAGMVVHGLVDRGMLAVLGAASKSYKTWLSFQLAAAVAYTGDWLGFKCEPGKVLYVNFELTQRSMQKRLRAVAEALKIKLDGRITFVGMKGASFEPAGLLQALTAKVKKENFSLCIIDPLYVLEQGAGAGKSRDNEVENSNFAMGRTMMLFIQMAIKANCALWVTQHYGKGAQAGKDPLDRLVGAGVQGRALDSAVLMTKHAATDPQAKAKAFSLEFETRNHREIDPFVVRWAYPLLVEDVALDPADLAVPKSAHRPREHFPQDLLKLLPSGGLSNADWIKEAGEAGIKERTFYSLKSDLAKAGLVVRDGDFWRPESDSK